MSCAAIVYDIDGTLTTGDPRAVARLHAYGQTLGADAYINTARSAKYCDDPSETMGLVKAENTHCLVHSDVPTSKVRNMYTIQRTAGVRDPSCVILIDDLQENVQAARNAGFGQELVHPDAGIRSDTVDRVSRSLQRCCLK